VKVISPWKGMILSLNVVQPECKTSILAKLKNGYSIQFHYRNKEFSSQARLNRVCSKVSFIEFFKTHELPLPKTSQLDYQND